MGNDSTLSHADYDVLDGVAVIKTDSLCSLYTST